MLIAISGSQGSGKSTLLNHIKQLGYNTIERKTSRSILSDWKTSLQEVNNNPDLTIKFQNEIISRKFQDEYSASLNSEIYFTERTYADLMAYYLCTLGHNNDYSNNINEYYKKCDQYNQTYDFVFYLKSGLFPIEMDGTRGTNQHYGRVVDLAIEDILKRTIQSNKLITINTPNIADRISTIELAIQDLKPFEIV